MIPPLADVWFHDWVWDTLIVECGDVASAWIDAAEWPATLALSVFLRRCRRAQRDDLEARYAAQDVRYVVLGDRQMIVAIAPNARTLERARAWIGLSVRVLDDGDRALARQMERLLAGRPLVASPRLSA